MKDNIFKNNVRIISSISILGISILNCNASNLTSKGKDFIKSENNKIIEKEDKKYNNCIDKIENTNVITSINSIKEKGINTDLILNNDHNNSIKNKKQDPESEAYKSFLQEAYKRYENGCIIIAVFDKNQNEHVNEIENNFKNQLKSRNITNFSDYFHSEEKVIDIYNTQKDYEEKDNTKNNQEGTTSVFIYNSDIIENLSPTEFRKNFKKAKSIKIIGKLNNSTSKTENQNSVNLKYLFKNFEFLEELDLSEFNTQNVTDMSGMFYECKNLRRINLSNFNTNEVTNMRYMFNECSALNELNLSSFNTDNVTNMQGMFYKCSNLYSLDLSNFNTNKVNDMSAMFHKCSNLKICNYYARNVLYML